MFRVNLSVVFVLLAGAAVAQEPTLKPIVLTLHAPKPSQRKLQYPLLVPLSEQSAGNAVTDYKEANKKHKQLISDEGAQLYNERLDAWLQLPLKELPRKEMAEFFTHYQEVFQAMETGAHREHADWEHLAALRKKGVATLLGEDFQQMRGLVRLLCVRIRFHLAEGKIDHALKDLQTGFTMARHTGASPTLIGSLIEIAMTSLLAERMEELLSQPSVPSLYWSLSEMPTFFSTLSRPMQGERLGVYGSFPGLLDAATDLDAGPLTPEQVRNCVKAWSQFQQQFQQLGLSDVLALASEVRLGLAIMQKHEAAKRALIAAGRPKEKVEAMPHIQVALLHSFLQYDRVLDEMLVAQQLPPWGALPKVREWNAKKLEDLDKQADAPAIPLLRIVLPGTEKVYRAHLRIDRRLAALRCIEALRLYAAANDGRFPASLKDIKEIIVPLDPGTGKLFEYQVKDNKATLHAPPLASEKNVTPWAFTYELTFGR